MRAPYAQRAAPEYAGSGPRKLDLLGGSQLAVTSTPADTSTARLKYLLRLHALGPKPLFHFLAKPNRALSSKGELRFGTFETAAPKRCRYEDYQLTSKPVGWFDVEEFAAYAPGAIEMKNLATVDLPAIAAQPNATTVETIDDFDSVLTSLRPGKLAADPDALAPLQIEDTTMELVKNNGAGSGGQMPSELNPFDPAQFRIDPNAESSIGIHKVITIIPVRKPFKTDFIRVHPAEEYRLDTYLIDVDADKETYLLHPSIVVAMPDPAYYMATLYLAITRQGILFLWPIKHATPGTKASEWHVSARLAAQTAMARWIRVYSNRDLGAYEYRVATGDVSEPIWPKLTLQDILRVAFREHLVNSLDHRLIKRLKGEAL